MKCSLQHLFVGLSESKAHSAVEAGSPERSQSPDMEEPSAQGEMQASHPDFEPDDDKENSVHPSAADDESDRESDEDSDGGSLCVMCVWFLFRQKSSDMFSHLCNPQWCPVKLQLLSEREGKCFSPIT